MTTTQEETTTQTTTQEMETKNTQQPTNEEKPKNDAIKLTEDGGVLKRIIREGEGDETPTEGSEVEVHYVGKLLKDGKQFDSSRDRNQPFKFTLGKDVIKGWNIGIATMKKGEIAEFTITHEYGYGKQGFPPSIPPEATLVFEVELLDFTESEDGIYKKVLKEGQGEETPLEGAKCKVNYKINLEDGTEIESRMGYDLVIGDEQVIPGIEKCISSMKLGETAVTKIRPKHGYGKEGNEKLKVPPNATLLATIELIAFVQPKNPFSMNPSQKIEYAEEVKNEGNEFFKQKNYKLALKRYEKALDVFPKYTYNFTDEEKKKMNQLKAILMNNIAQVHLNNKNITECIKFCNQVLEIDKKNIKALYKRGKCYTLQKEWHLARDDFNLILAQDPKNKEVLRAKQRVMEEIRKINKRELKRFGGMFEKLAKEEEEEAKRQKLAEEKAKETKEETKEETKDDAMEESKEETKEEKMEETKEIKEETMEETKEEETKK